MRCLADSAEQQQWDDDREFINGCMKKDRELTLSLKGSAMRWVKREKMQNGFIAIS